MLSGPGLAAGVGGGGGSWFECVGEPMTADGVVILGVGGPLGRVCTIFSIRDGIRALFVSRVSAALVGEEDPPSSKLTMEARRSVRLKGLYRPSMPSIMSEEGLFGYVEVDVA